MTSDFFQTTLKMYLGLIAISLGLIYFFGPDLKMLVYANLNKDFWIRGFFLTISSLIILFSVSQLVENYFGSYREDKSVLAKTIGSLGFLEIFLLALASSFGEELLFRGFLQDKIGYILCNLIFALLHIAPGRSIGLWALLAFLAGSIFSQLTIHSDSLIFAIFCHFVINFVGLWELSNLEPKTNLSSF